MTHLPNLYSDLVLWNWSSRSPLLCHRGTNDRVCQNRNWPGRTYRPWTGLFRHAWGTVLWRELWCVTVTTGTQISLLRLVLKYLTHQSDPTTGQLWCVAVATGTKISNFRLENIYFQTLKYLPLDTKICTFRYKNISRSVSDNDLVTKTSTGTKISTFSRLLLKYLKDHRRSWACLPSPTDCQQVWTCLTSSPESTCVGFGSVHIH